MNFRAFFRALRLRGWTVALITLAAVAVSLAFTLVQVPMYASTAHLFVAAGDSAAKQGNQSQFADQRIRSYVEVVDGDALARRVIKRLNLNESPRELSDQVDASADAKSVVLSVRVKDPSADRAQLLADAVAKEFIAFLGELETSAPSAAPIKATLVDAADLPTKPATPSVPLNLGIGLGVGLLLGLLWAWIRERFDTTVRTPSVLEDATDAPMLGAILFDENSFDEPTIRTLDHYDPRVEGYRVLRTSLEFLDEPGSSAVEPVETTRRSKVYVVTSAVPGEGKTTTAINLALILAEGGEKVMLVEADLRRPTISEYLDLNPATGLTTTLIGRTTLAEAVQEVGALDVLTSGRRPPNPAELVKSQAMRALIEQLRKSYSYVLIDAPPLLPVTDASLLAAASDGVILVTRYGDTKEVELAAAITRIKSVNGKVVGSILNMTPASDVDGYGYGYGYAPDEHGHGHGPGPGHAPAHATARHEPQQEKPRKPKKVKAPKKADVVVETVPYASLLARLEPIAASVVEPEPPVEPEPAMVEPEPPVEPESVDITPAIDPNSIQSGQSLLEQIEAAMARAQSPVAETDESMVETERSVDEPVETAADETAESVDEPVETTADETVESVVEPDPTLVEPVETTPSDDFDTPASRPAQPTDEPEPDPEPTGVAQPASEVEPEPERPMVWPASWAVQTARSFVESEPADDESAETTHRFPGVETDRPFVESEPSEVEPEGPVADPAETDPDEEDLVAEAEPTFEPTESED